MYLELNGNIFYLYGGFREKISELNKERKLEIEINLYITEEEKDIKRKSYLENLKKLPEILYFSNSYYYWIFEGVKLENKEFFEDYVYRTVASSYYQTSRFETQKKFIFKMEFSFDKVTGTNNRLIFDRDLLLRKFLD